MANRLRRSDWRRLELLWERLWEASPSEADAIVEKALAERLEGATLASIKLRRFDPYEQSFVERALRALEARKGASAVPSNGPSPLKAIFDGVPAGILVWDEGRNILACNTRGEQILKLPLSKNIGKGVHETVRARDGFMEGVTTVSRAGKIVTRQSMVISLEGEERTIGYSGGPILGPSGRTEGWVLLFQDISSIVSA